MLAWCWNAALAAFAWQTHEILPELKAIRAELLEPRLELTKPNVKVRGANTARAAFATVER